MKMEDNSDCESTGMDEMEVEERVPAGNKKKHMKEMPMQEACMEMVLAHAYVPWQVYDKAFSPCEALMKGTLFPSLWGVYPIPE